MDNNVQNSESYLSSVYDYCLDLIQSLIGNLENSDYDEDLDCYFFDYKFSCKKKIFEGIDGKIKLPFNEINDFFKIQSFENIFKKVCSDLGLKIKSHKNGYSTISIRKIDYKKILDSINMINQSSKHSDSINNEEPIYQSLKFIFNCNCVKEGNVDIVRFSIDYDEINNQVILKNIANSRLMIYKTFNMSLKEYKVYLNNLFERLDLIGFTVMNYGNNKLIITSDISRSEKDFYEYYSEGIKLTKRN